MEIKRHKIRKKIFCILLAAFCIVCTAGFADRHTEVRCQFSEVFGSQTASIDIYEQDDMIAVSSLLPDIAVVFPEEISAYTDSLTNMLNLLSEKDIYGLYNKAEQIFLSWLEMQPNEQQTGNFSGDIFQKADNMKSYEFTLSSFTEHLNSITEEKKDNGISSLLGMLLHQINRDINQENSDDILIKAGNYNNGCYYTFTLLRENSVLFTVSADCSSSQQRHIVAGYRIAGKQYYRDLEFDFRKKEQLNITYCLYNGTGTYRNTIKDRKPLFQEKYVITWEKNNHVFLNNVLESENLSDNLCCDTVFCPGGNGECTISQRIYFQNKTEQNVEICVTVEPTIRRVEFNDKIKKHFNQEEKAETEEAVYTAIIQLAAEILPVLPEEYRTILFKLLIN